MKYINQKFGMRFSAFCLSIAIVLVSVFPAQAVETVDDLENTTSGLESELSNLNKELETLEKELDDILSQIKTISAELETTKEELAIAKGLEEAQYESMKLRIKYMYENGNFTIMEMLFSSTCMAEFLSQVEFYSAITEYDRALLTEFTKTREQVAKKETSLIETQEYLSSLQKELDAKEKELTSKISSTSDELTKYTAKLEKAREEAKKAEEAAKEQITPVVPQQPESSGGSSSSSSTTTLGSGVAYTEDDLILLAALIECEAGSRNYEGMLAVGSVVVNRMKSRYYPNTLYGVVYQSGQFSPTWEGKLDKVLARGVKDSCVVAAKDALNGKNNVGDCLSFRSASSGRPGLVIGGNVFF